MKRLFLSLLLISQLGLATAQITPITEKFFLNFELNSQQITLDQNNNSADKGGGLGFRAGYGFTPTFSIYLGFSGARLTDSDNQNGSYRLAMAELGTRLHFGKKLKSPTFYLDIAFQSAETRADEPDLSFSGGSLGLGGGLLVFVGQQLAIDLGLRGSAGNFSEFRIGKFSVNIDEENIRYGAGRLSVGITWFLMRK
jgi:hypothetical protein